MNKHEFHLVENSTWPYVISLNLFSFTVSLVLIVQQYSKGLILMYLSLMTFVMIIYYWWYNIITEAGYMGYHNQAIIRALLLGIVLFIVSEIFLFIGLFWAYIHSALNCTPALGELWPPLGIGNLSPLELPLLNTLLLLSAGFSVTWAHHAYITSNPGSHDKAVREYLNPGSKPTQTYRSKTIGLIPGHIGFIIGITLAFVFTFFQYVEYKNCSFDISDSAFGSCFYLATSLHGIHVIIGALFLGSAFIRMNLYHFTKTQHVNFICSLWYFHFTDAVWLFLYIVFYVWGFGY